MPSSKFGPQRAKILDAMKEALVRGDEDEALERARELTGLTSKRPTLRNETEFKAGSVSLEL
jgi:hypothetical protein